MHLPPPALLAAPSTTLPEAQLLERVHVALHHVALQSLAARVSRVWDAPGALAALEHRIADSALGRVDVRQAPSGRGWSVQAFGQRWVSETLEKRRLAQLLADEVSPAEGPLLVQVCPDPLPVLLEDETFVALVRRVAARTSPTAARAADPAIAR